MWSLLFSKGKIPELLPRSSIDEQTRLVLVNAVYFKGRWEEPFLESCTLEMPFKVNQVRRTFEQSFDKEIEGNN